MVLFLAECTRLQGQTADINYIMKGTEYGDHVCLKQVILKAIMRKTISRAVSSEGGTGIPN